MIYKACRGSRLAKTIMGLASLSVILFAWVMVSGHLSSAAQSSDAVRLTIVARGMAFYRAEQPETANPSVTVSPNQPIVIRFINRSSGSRHQLTIQGTDIATRVLGPGESILVRLPPLSPGHDLTYLCSLHPVTMEGTIRVKSSD